MSIIAPIIELAQEELERSGKQTCWPYYEEEFHAAAQEAVKTSGVIFRKEDRIPYEKRNECKRPDHISVGGRLPRRYFNRQRTHLYFACR